MSFKNSSNVDAVIDLVVNGENLNIDQLIKGKKSVDVTLQINPDLVGLYGVNDIGHVNALTTLGVLLLSTKNNLATNVQITAIVVDGINTQTEFSEGHTEYTQSVFDASGQPLNNSNSMTSTGQYYENYFRFGGNPSGSDLLLGEAGNDVINGMRGDDIISGGLGNDILDGGTGNDRLYGDEGDDIIYGGLGNDFIAGGAGNDKLYAYYASSFETVAEAVNLAKNLFSGFEYIVGDGKNSESNLLSANPEFDGAAFFGGGISASDGADEIFTSDNPYIRYILYGQGGDDIIHNDVNNRTSNGVDFIFGGSSEAYTFNLALDGYQGLVNRSDMSVNAALYDGNDQIWGQNGTDIILGGFGNDTIYGGGGDDELRGDLYVNAFVYVSPDSVSTDYFFVRFSNVSAYQGNDIIHGGDGDDQITGGLGSDALYGDNGDDTIFGGVDFVEFSYGLVYMANTDFLQAERKTLHDGSDTIEGGAGNDRIFAGLGDDIVHGGIDDDIILGDNVGLSFTQSTILTPTSIKFNYFSFDYSVSLSSNNPHDWLIDGQDHLYGDEGNDLIIGLGNDDTMVGGHGADLIVGGGIDLTSINTGGTGFFAGNPNDSLEHVVESFYADGNDIIWGDNQMDAADNINNSDTVIAGFGNDVVYGEEGDDLIFGDNTLFGSPATINLLLPYNNELHYIHDGDDYLDGGKGNDTLVGQGGSDILYGREGNDSLYGDGSNYQIGAPDTSSNFLDGGQGNDVLVGADGDDYLIGGEGNDILVGGNGADTFAFSLASNFGQDVIVDFDANDTIAFTDVIGDISDYILGFGLIDYFGDSVPDATLFMDFGFGLATISFDNLDIDTLLNSISPSRLTQSVDPLWQPGVGGQPLPNLMPVSAVNSVASDVHSAQLSTLASTTVDGHSLSAASVSTSAAGVSAAALVDQANYSMSTTVYAQQPSLQSLLGDIGGGSGDLG